MTIETNLEVCYKTANMLKEEFPNDVMKITPTTIIMFSKKNSRMLRKGRNSMSGCHAYYSNSKPHRIVVRKKTLETGKVHSTYGGKQSLSIVPTYKKYVDLYNYTIHGGAFLGMNDLQGNWAMIDLMCHEFAHHRTKGHGKGFKIKYHRFLDYMVNKVISGEFYQ